MEYFSLLGGTKIPAFGLGTYQMTKREVVKNSILTAIKLGYRHFDTAEIYGNQAFVGEALEESGVPRNELFITTKIWMNHYKDVRSALKEDLKRLRTDYVDLLLLHQPLCNYVDAFKELIKLNKEGLVKAIGVSNFENEHIHKLIEKTGVIPEVNQIEIHPFCQRKDQVDYCKRNGILIEDWYPLANAKSKLLDNEVIKEIAKKYDKTPGQIILRWHFEIGHVAFPRATSEAHLKENIEIFNFTLDKEDVEKINALDTGKGYDKPVRLKKITETLKKANH